MFDYVSPRSMVISWDPAVFGITRFVVFLLFHERNCIGFISRACTQSYWIHVFRAGYFVRMCRCILLINETPNFLESKIILPVTSSNHRKKNHGKSAGDDSKNRPFAKPICQTNVVIQGPMLYTLQVFLPMPSRQRSDNELDLKRCLVWNDPFFLAPMSGV